ncbi:MAG: hypothetical protein ABMA15_03270 [Vicinamibacterales bacterium]
MGIDQRRVRADIVFVAATDIDIDIDIDIDVGRVAGHGRHIADTCSDADDARFQATRERPRLGVFRLLVVHT